MEFRLVAYWTASCASATVSIIHISVTNCAWIWIGSQRNSRAKKRARFSTRPLRFSLGFAID